MAKAKEAKTREKIYKSLAARRALHMVAPIRARAIERGTRRTVRTFARAAFCSALYDVTPQQVDSYIYRSRASWSHCLTMFRRCTCRAPQNNVHRVFADSGGAEQGDDPEQIDRAAELPSCVYISLDITPRAKI